MHALHFPAPLMHSDAPYSSNHSADPTHQQSTPPPQVTDCNGGKSTATASLTYEPPGKAVANTFTYSKSPLSLDFLKGVLTNDVNNPTCAAQGKPLKVTAWGTGSAGNVAVSSIELGEHECSCGVHVSVIAAIESEAAAYKCGLHRLQWLGIADDLLFAVGVCGGCMAK
jgi:hypothetical protein